MKTAAIIRIVTGAVVALLLIAILVAYFTGFNPFRILNEATVDRLQSWSTPEQNETETRNDGGKDNMNSGVFIGSGSVAAETITKINIDWVAGNVDVRFTDATEITFAETSKKSLTDAQKLHYKVKDGKLTISYCEQTNSVWQWFDLDKLNMPSKDLTVEIPKTMVESSALRELNVDAVSARTTVDGFAGEKLGVESVSGAVDIANVTVNDLSASSTSGRVTVSNAAASKCDVETVSGTCDISGAFSDMDVETVSGTVEVAVTGSEAPDKIDVDSVSGTLRVTIPDNSGFTAELDSISGSIRCDFAAVMEKKRITYGDGSRKYSFNSVSGGVTISKA